jgi:SH3-like domain-containing protein
MKKKIIILFLSILFIPIEFTVAKEKFLSLKKNKVYVRYGPSFDSPIKYVYKKVNLPVKQIDKKENWRRIVDLDNNSGWIHWRMLKKPNSIIILKNKVLFKKPTNYSKPLARLEKGRLLRVKECEENWCYVTTDDYSGWIKTNDIWGSIK